MFVNDAPDNHEAKAGSGFLGGEVRVKNAADLVGGYPGAVVDEIEKDVFVVEAGPDREFPVRTHRLRAVADQVVEDLLELVPVRIDEWQVLIEFERHGDAPVGDFGPDKVDGFVDEFVDVRRLRVRTGRADRTEEFLDDKIEALDFAAGNLDRFE